MQKKYWKWLVGFGMIAALSVYVCYQSDTPPEKEISEARLNLSIAEKLNSEKYASAQFQKGSEAYDSAMICWQVENERLFFLRDFSKVRWHASEASRLALASMEKSKVSSSSLKSQVEDMEGVLRSKFAQYESVYGQIALTSALSKAFAKSKLLFQEGIQAYKNGDYPQAKRKFLEVERMVDNACAYSKNILKTYLQNHADWQSWVDKSINESKKQKSTCIIVDKYARKCMLYKNGKMQRTYAVELGPNWIGDKRHQGDRSTPEGFYKVVKKKEGAETKYYKAFLLDYPNEEDKRRFAFNKEAGILKKNAAIGGLIEIHGHGGKGTDWTEGCIAVTDAEMDELYALCNTGTTVTIVGSLRSFQDIEKQHL